ncbi:MAG: Uma2 family endonuclease [Chloroflexi bacterium]|nr:MAG: Uma2 family endonuclease [Chloroflexota bacterium]
MATSERLSVVTPADWVPGPPQGSWTYDDYAALPDDGNRYEIVRGVLVMTPAPSPEHQDIVGEIFSALRTHIKLAGLGRVFTGPIDVDLGPKNVYQPDLVVVLNTHLDRVAEKKIIGAPDLVVEVASPSTAAYDRLTKYEKYAHAGIREYWLVKPTSRSVEVLVLEGREYRSLGIFRGEQTLPSRIVPDLPVGVERFFA